MIDHASLRALLERDDGRDRAFVDAIVRMAWSRTGEPDERALLVELHTEVRAASLQSHAPVRRRIAAGLLRGAELRAYFEAVSADDRDHLVEEVLGIAYPPLDEPELPPELLAYAPSGYDELVYAFDMTGLGSGDRFLDLGSGTGKAVMLATLLTGATGTGIECNAALHELAVNAAHRLALDEVHFTCGDARDVALAAADVVFMYLPFTGRALATVMGRLMEAAWLVPPSRARFLCAGALDVRRYPDLVVAARPKSWLHVYRHRSA